MLIEIHMIQNHSPANLNRDDLGAPKTCIFGGVTRARISSQCLKRSIRRSKDFSAALEKDGGVRTRRLIELIAKEAAGEGNQPKKEDCVAIRKVFTDAGVGLKDENTFDILFFLPQSAISEMGAAVRDGNGDLGERFAEIIGKFVKTPDIALCGRMTEFDAKGAFAGLKGKFTVEGALYAADALSTHAVVNEVDYFTAADDVPGQDSGAAHVNEAMFNSACFYKYFAIDFEQLKKNLENDNELASKTVRSFLKAAAQAYPSGKQHAHAAFNLPDGVLVEVKTQSATPISYSNAFANPVPEKSERGLIGESIARLGQHVHDLVVGYGIESERFWFSPNLCYRLTCIAKDENRNEKEQSVAGPFGEFKAFVNAVIKKINASGTSAETAK
ncbi:MAG: type I-E CRISPR-associated protein Cas7/Cse4/CasC [Solidesulfovibrio sp. DCME]|uniref:type I-E CRISPR-associated protein Cas7/Cse4/CasC n=1 Tax=Solidesulfovibrio sp. DCME TaxID=3447380 RepID=UPI003D133025